MLEKICPKCNKEYSNLFFVCFDDYTTLEDKKLILSNPESSSVTSSKTKTYSYTKQPFPFTPEEFVGKTLNGKYEINRFVGIEGIVTIYHGTLVLPQTLPVIIKVIDFAPFREFYNEHSLMHNVEQLAKFNDSTVLGAMDFGVFSNNFYYLIYEFTERKTFQKLISSGYQFDILQSLQIAKSVCLALEQAHKNGIFEQLTPDNILLSNLDSEAFKTEDIKVQIDFSTIKKLFCLGLTHPLVLYNDILYMAPEIAENTPSSTLKANPELTPQANIYSIGCFLYHMLTESPPFKDSDNLTLIFKQIHTLTRPPKEINGKIPVELNNFICKLLAKQPLDRIQSFAQLHKELTYHEQHAMELNQTKEPLQRVKATLLTDKPFPPEDEPFPPHLIKTKNIPSRKIIDILGIREPFQLFLKKLRKYHISLYKGKGAPKNWKSPTGLQPDPTHSGFLLTPIRKSSILAKIFIYQNNYNLTNFSLKLLLRIRYHSTFNVVFGEGFSTTELWQNSKICVVCFDYAHGDWKSYHTTISHQNKKCSFTKCIITENEWIEMQVIVYKSTISVYLNGILTNQTENVPITPGQVGIFSALGDVYIDRILIVH